MNMKINMNIKTNIKNENEYRHEAKDTCNVLSYKYNIMISYHITYDLIQYNIIEYNILKYDLT